MRTLYVRYGKRVFDLVISIPLFAILIPLFLVVAFLILIDSSGPVFFTQERIGLNKKPFKLYKFRTMVKKAAEIGPLVTSAHDPRTTKIGKILRRFKIDELPQLLNVIKGDMSIVGPRPEVKKYVNMFGKDYEEILKIKPGITDYATIAFRKEEEILSKFGNVEEAYTRHVLPEKIKLYRKYLSEISLMTDLKIILKTIWEISKG